MTYSKEVNEIRLIIEQDMDHYEEALHNITNNYKKIKEEIGLKTIRSDNKHFKTMMTRTYDDLLILNKSINKL